jgi:streptogramin lyase
MMARRLSVCAASALASLVLASSGWGAYVRDFTKPDDFNTGTLKNATYSKILGGLSLPEVTTCVPYLWVPSPSQNIVSKIDARTGQELARYRMGRIEDQWRPCGVASDLAGNAWVVCTNPGRMGRVVRIRATSKEGWAGPAVSKTSTDSDGNGRISGDELLEYGSDGCVGPVVETGMGSEPISVIFDEAGRLWAALAGESSLVQIDIASASVIARVSLPGKPSLMTSDGDGSIWVVSQETGTLYRVGTDARKVMASYRIGDCNPTAMCCDLNGKLWISDEYIGLIGLQTKSGVWSKITDDGTGFTGVAVDEDGDVWTACPVKGELAHYSGVDGSLVITIPMSNSVGAVSLDGDGMLWVLNRETSSAIRIDPHQNNCVAAAITGLQPYSTTSFAGSILDKGICADGLWKLVLDSGSEGSGWSYIDWDYSSNGGSVRIEARSSETIDGLEAQPFQRIHSGEPMTVPNGRFLEVRTVMLSDHRQSPVLSALHVEGAESQAEMQQVASAPSDSADSSSPGGDTQPASQSACKP